MNLFLHSVLKQRMLSCRHLLAVFRGRKHQHFRWHRAPHSAMVITICHRKVRHCNGKNFGLFEKGGGEILFSINFVLNIKQSWLVQFFYYKQIKNNILATTTRRGLFVVKDQQLLPLIAGSILFFQKLFAINAFWWARLLLIWMECLKMFLFLGRFWC